MLLKKRGELAEDDETEFFHTVLGCMPETGLLIRGPGLEHDLEGPDDYYGVAAGCKATDNRELAEWIIEYGWKHWGSFNNVEPGKWTRQSWLWRQPQLMFALYCAAEKRPLLWKPWTWWLYPHLWITALIIATSCMPFLAAKTDWDARRLSRLLVFTTADSWLCRAAGWIWKRRLYRDWPGGMKDVDAAYYQPGHPFAQYEVD